MNTPGKILIAAAIAFGAGVSGYSQTAPTAPHPTINLDLTRLSPELRALITQLQADAVELRGLALALRNQLKDKTADERRAIIEQFRKDHSALIDAQRTLAKQIRNEMKLLRQQRRGTG